MTPALRVLRTSLGPTLGFAAIFENMESMRGISLLTVLASFVSLNIAFCITMPTFTFAEETRIRWLQTRTRADALYGKIKEVVNSGIFKTEDVLTHLFALLSGGWEDTKDKSADAYEKTKSKVGEGRAYADEKAGEASGWAGEKVDDVKKSAGDKIHDAREAAGEKVKVSGQKLKGEL
jgi:hypothetical protein